MRHRTVVVALAALCLACGGRGEESDPEPDIACTMEARSAFAVTVVDAVTGRNLAPAARVRVTDGEYSENLTAFGGGVYSGAHERSGTFTIVVSHPDYDQWQRAGVVVERDECHVITEAVEARLTPE